MTKALGLTVDEVIFDLEDAVAPDRKVDARSLLSETLSHLPEESPAIAVRVNQIGTPWFIEDVLTCAREPRVGSIVLPKVESAADIHLVDRLIDTALPYDTRPHPLAIQVLIESAGGVKNADDIAASSPRITSVILGYADLAASLGCKSTVPLDVWASVKLRLLVAARASGISAIDGPYLMVDTGPDFRAHVRQAADLGFDGTWVIHPRQIDDATAAYSPTLDELDRARRIIDALDQSHRQGSGAVSLDGQMIDEALAVAARRVVSRAANA